MAASNTALGNTAASTVADSAAVSFATPTRENPAEGGPPLWQPPSYLCGGVRSDVDGRDLADALYLAAFLYPDIPALVKDDGINSDENHQIQQEAGSKHATTETGEKRENEEEKEPGDVHSPPVSTAETPASTELKRGFVGKVMPVGPSPVPTHAGVTAFDFASPDARAVPDLRLLARALRFLPRAVPDPTHTVLDVEATVSQWTEQLLLSFDTDLTPVLRPEKSRWAAVALVIDRSPTMEMWRAVAEDIASMLRWQGSFRDVRIWEMDTAAASPASDGSDFPTLYSVASPLNPKNRAENAAARSYRELLSARRDRIVIVLTDALAPAWRDGRAFRLLQEVGRRTGVVVWHTLPESLWGRTGVGVPRWRVQSQVPGPVNTQLIAAPRPGAANPFSSALRRASGAGETKAPAESEATVPLPVLALSEAHLGAWARLQAGAGRAFVPALLLRPDLNTTETMRALADAAKKEIAPDEALARFLEVSTGLARKLARLYTVVPLTLPIMRLVQRSILPDSTQAHLAEFMMSGLVKSDDSFFRWVDDGVRNQLMDALSGPEAEFVIQSVGAFLDVPPETARRFAARLEISERGGTLPNDPVLENLTPLQEAYAELSEKSLRDFGFLRPPADNSPIVNPPEPPAEEPRADETDGQIRPLLPKEMAEGLERCLHLLTSKEKEDTWEALAYVTGCNAPHLHEERLAYIFSDALQHTASAELVEYGFDDKTAAFVKNSAEQYFSVAKNDVPNREGDGLNQARRRAAIVASILVPFALRPKQPREIEGIRQRINQIKEVWQALLNDARTLPHGFTLTTMPGFGSEIFRFAWSTQTSQATLAIPCSDGKVRFWEPSPAPAGGEIQAKQVSSYGINQAAWKPLGRNVALSCFDTKIHVVISPSGDFVDVGTGRIDTKEDKGFLHNSDVQTVDWSPDGRYIASGTKRGTVRVWQLRSRKPYYLWPNSSEGRKTVNVVAWMPNYTEASTTSPNEQILAFGGHNGLLGFVKKNGLNFANPPTLFGNDNKTVVTLTWLPSTSGARRFVTGDADGGLAVWDVDTSKKQFEIDAVPDAVPKSPQRKKSADTGMMRIEIGYDGTGQAVPVDVDTGTKQFEIDAVPKYPQRQNSVETGKKLFEIQAHEGAIVGLSVSAPRPTNSSSEPGAPHLLACKSQDGNVTLWEILEEDQKIVLAQLPPVLKEAGPKVWWSHLAFHPTDPDVLATLSDDTRSLRLWRLDRARMGQSHRAAPNNLAADSDSELEPVADTVPDTAQNTRTADNDNSASLTESKNVSPRPGSLSGMRLLWVNTNSSQNEMTPETLRRLGAQIVRIDAAAYKTSTNRRSAYEAVVCHVEPWHSAQIKRCIDVTQTIRRDAPKAGDLDRRKTPVYWFTTFPDANLPQEAHADAMAYSVDELVPHLIEQHEQGPLNEPTGFYTARGICEVVKKHLELPDNAPNPVLGLRLTFNPKTQNTWLAVTSTHLFGLLDDPNTTAKNSVVQWSVPLDKAGPVFTTLGSSESTYRLNIAGRKEPWLCSSFIHPDRETFEQDLRAMILDAAQPDLEPLLRETLLLGEEYDAARFRYLSSDARTTAMTAVADKMKELIRKSAPVDLSELLPALAEQISAGARLVATLILVQYPSASYLTWLTGVMDNDQPFVGYHAALAIVSTADHLKEGDSNTLRRARLKISDRNTRTL